MGRKPVPPADPRIAPWARVLRAQREARGWTQDDVADAIVQAAATRGWSGRDIPETLVTVARHEAGTRVPSGRALVLYADVLGIEVGPLLGGEWGEE